MCVCIHHMISGTKAGERVKPYHNETHDGYSTLDTKPRKKRRSRKEGDKFVKTAAPLRSRNNAVHRDQGSTTSNQCRPKDKWWAKEKSCKKSVPK